MGLLNSENGQYLRITRVDVHFEKIGYEIYESLSQRQKGSLTDFEKTKKDNLDLTNSEYYQDFVDKWTKNMADGKKTIKNNMITMAYELLKLDKFSHWADQEDPIGESLTN